MSYKDSEFMDLLLSNCLDREKMSQKCVILEKPGCIVFKISQDILKDKKNSLKLTIAWTAGLTWLR